ISASRPKPHSEPKETEHDPIWLAGGAALLGPACERSPWPERGTDERGARLPPGPRGRPSRARDDGIRRVLHLVPRAQARADLHRLLDAALALRRLCPG